MTPKNFSYVILPEIQVIVRGAVSDMYSLMQTDCEYPMFPSDNAALLV